MAGVYVYRPVMSVEIRIERLIVESFIPADWPGPCGLLELTGSVKSFGSRDRPVVLYRTARRADGLGGTVRWCVTGRLVYIKNFAVR